MSIVQWAEFNILGDDRGALVSIEGEKNIPFDIKRVYYIYGVQPGIARGFHAHKALEQIAVCVSGQCKMLLDDGKNKEEVWLNSPEKGIYIRNMVWREMHEFSADCVLLVLASARYDEVDYIRDYSVFLAQVKCHELYSSIS